jgi:hypothetical protein
MAGQERVMSDFEQNVRELAYRLWEQAGWPEGGSEEFWFAAEKELAERNDDGSRDDASIPKLPSEEMPFVAAAHGLPVGMPGERLAEPGVLDDRLQDLVVKPMRPTPEPD